MSEQDFNEWLDDNAMRIPLVAWGPKHTKIAVMFAEEMAANAVRKTLDDALNSGDGSYKP